MKGLRPSPQRLSSGLLAPEERQARRRAAYYDQLNGNPEFLAGLRVLAAEVDPRASHDPPVARQLWTFARTWHLPRKRARIELAGSLRSAVARQTEPRLIVPTIGHWVPDVAAELIPLLSPIHYDPVTMTMKQLAARIEQAAAELRQSLRDQAAAIRQQAKAAGWERESARYLADGELDRLARRLYWRAVLGWTYVAIADKEKAIADEEDPDPKREHFFSPQAVQTSVKDWAEDLDVALT